MRKLVFVILMFLSCVLIVNLASGKTSHKESDIVYEIHEIKSGDTLWDIAGLYKYNDCSTSQYVKEIMEFNNMKNDKIISGQNIIIPVHKY
ncbi:LysM peptidoglycan-binding domain-containing protein [Lachnospiraceae bacterium NSJ-143]|nr:LysM peptidoglycan-binding domain-containing protein [Lachnospiraceae bacterium NSJ-143]